MEMGGGVAPPTRRHEAMSKILHSSYLMPPVLFWFVAALATKIGIEMTFSTVQFFFSPEWKEFKFNVPKRTLSTRMGARGIDA